MTAGAGVTACLLGTPDPDRAGLGAEARASVAFAGELREIEWAASGEERAERLAAAIHGARYPFVLLLSADEVVSPELATEIQALVAGVPAAPSYRVPRRGRYLGREVSCPDWQGLGPIRLIDRRAPYTIDPERGALAVLGPTGELAGAVHVHGTMSLTGMIRDIALATRGAAGPPPPAHRFCLAPMIELWRSFWRRGGMRGGRAGLFLATMDSFYVLVDLARRWAAQAPAQAPSQAPSGSASQR